MPRHAKPPILLQYEAIVRDVPRICHTCWLYDANGKCKEFDNDPPEEFAATDRLCGTWQEAPF